MGREKSADGENIGFLADSVWISRFPPKTAQLAVWHQLGQKKQKHSKQNLKKGLKPRQKVALPAHQGTPLLCENLARE